MCGSNATIRVPQRFLPPLRRVALRCCGSLLPLVALSLPDGGCFTVVAEERVPAVASALPDVSIVERRADKLTPCRHR